MSYKYLEASTLVGRIASQVEQVGTDRLEITMDDGKRYAFLHNQDCCESVGIHDVAGDLTSLVGSPFTVATHDSDGTWPSDVDAPSYQPESFTWTTLTFETAKARVVIRWLGQSNGYYGEGVSMEELT
jgi:hypothetical protein